MGHVKYTLDPASIKSWAPRIGQLILNFAGLEFESYLWIVQMSEQPERIPEFAKQPFRFRVNVITEFIEVWSFSEQWKAKALGGWDSALELAKLRNQIAHNPLVFTWINESEKGEPDFIGVADMQRHEQSEGTEGPLLSRTDIDTAVDQIAKLVLRLSSLRSDWCALRDRDNGLVQS